MVQPPSFKDDTTPHHVCWLNKAIYGLKQAPRAWYLALKGAILEFGFVNSKADSSLFIYKTKSVTCYFVVYVTDLVITGNDPIFVSSINVQLGNRFSLKDMGQLPFFLGMKVIPTTTGLLLSQHKYIRDLLTCMEKKRLPLHCPQPLCSSSLMAHPQLIVQNSEVLLFLCNTYIS